LNRKPDSNHSLASYFGATPLDYDQSSIGTFDKFEVCQQRALGFCGDEICGEVPAIGRSFTRGHYKSLSEFEMRWLSAGRSPESRNLPKNYAMFLRAASKLG